MVEPRLLQGLKRLCNNRPKVNIRSRPRWRKGLILAGGQSLIKEMSPITSCKAVLQYLVIAVWSKGMYKVRAKIIKGSAGIKPNVALACRMVHAQSLCSWFICWRSAAVERLQQVSKVLLIVEQRLV